MKNLKLDELRNIVKKIERGDVKHKNQIIPIGLPELDDNLSGGGLVLGHIHEVIGETRSEVRDASPFGFTIALLTRIFSNRNISGDVLWCLRPNNLFGGALSAFGLAFLGLDSNRIIQLVARNDNDRLWAMEEGLNSYELAAVVVELGPIRPDLGIRNSVVYRRLQLVAEKTGVTGFLVRPDAGAIAFASTTPETRWRVISRPSGDWRPHWHVELMRSRNGKISMAEVIWDSASKKFLPKKNLIAVQPFYQSR